MTILVTSNFDKAVLTGCTAQLFAQRRRQPLFRWKRELKKELPPEIRRLVYDEESNPELFAYFVAGVPAQVLDNNSGNVGWGVANGTACSLHSMAWECEEKTSAVLSLIQQARRTNQLTIDLPFPPDFINVTLLDSSREPLSAHQWPEENNLETEWKMSATGERVCKASVIIPIGLMGARTRKRTVRLGKGVLAEPCILEFVQHAVDIAQVMTVWKAQGATLRRVVLCLEPTQRHAPKWGFEHIYVGVSRVTAAKYLRCLPLSGGFRKAKLFNLRPSIFTTKWRMDNRTQQ